MSFIKSSLKSISGYLREGQLLVLESTTYPGTTEEIIKPFAESLGFKIGHNFYVAYSPEREDPGNKKFTTTKIPKVIGGITEMCTHKAIEVYSLIIDQIVPVSDAKTAEMTKLLENIHRAVNIGLMNELKPLSVE